MPAVRRRAPGTGAPRLSVRTLGCWTTCPWPRSLPSTSSAGPLGRPWCDGFLGTLQRSDSLPPSITGVSRGFPVRTWLSHTRPEAGPPGCRTAWCRACQRAPTPPGPSTPHHPGAYGMAFRVCGARRHPGVARLRGSILCLYLPLSTLRRRRYRRRRRTRGQGGWRDLPCEELASFTHCRFSSAHPNAGHELRLEAGAT